MEWSRSVSVMPDRELLPALPPASAFTDTQVFSPTRKALTDRAEFADWLRRDPWPLPGDRGP